MNTVISTVMTASTAMAETTEKVTFASKAKNFVKAHKTAFIVGGTAVAGVGAGVIIGAGAEKTKSNGGLKLGKLKKKDKEEGEETSEEEDPSEKEIKGEDIIDIDPLPIQEEEPVKDKCETECDKKHSA